MSARRLASLLAAAIVAAAVAVGAAQGASRDWYDDASLLVEAKSGDSPGLHLSLGFGDRGAPGHVTLYVPKGFEVYPQRPPGYPVGVAAIEAGNSSYGSFSDAIFLGQIQATVVDSPLAAAAQACAPGTYIALWKLTFTLLGQPVELPVSVAATGSGDPPDSAYRIDLCPPPVPGPDPATAPVLPIQTLEVILEYVPAPTRHAAYVWHAVVTPVAPDGRTLLPAQAYELRSTVPVPHLLTLSGRRVNGRSAVLTGRLTAAGQLQAHAPITITRLVRKILRNGSVEFLDSIAGETRTDGQGAYSLRVPLRSTSGFVASADETEVRCAGAALAPAGCISSTTAGTSSVPVTLSVSKPAG